MNQHLTEQPSNTDSLDYFPVVEASIFSDANNPIIIGEPRSYRWIYELPQVGLYEHLHPNELQNHFIQTGSLKNLPKEDLDLEGYRSLLESSMHIDPTCKVVVRNPEDNNLTLVHVFVSRAFDQPVYFTLEDGLIGIHKKPPVFREDDSLVFPPDYDIFLDIRKFIIDTMLMMANDPILLMQFIGTSWDACETMMMDPELWESAISAYKEWYK